MLVMFFFLSAGEERENPWKDRVAPAVEQAKRDGQVGSYWAALNAAWRADDWRTGLDLARTALEKHPDEHELKAAAARAYWRAGLMAEAERLVDELSPRSSDRVALAARIMVNLARGDRQATRDAAGRLEALKDVTGEDLYYVVGARFVHNELRDLGQLIRRAAKLTDPDNGYPEMYVLEQLEGLPEFFEAIGDEPVNQVTSCGKAMMPPIPLINLPGCQVMINGRGPYRMIVDTGGSITLSLDTQVAAELGLKSIVNSTVHGVSGKQDSGQVLVDELRIGEITCRRVLTRTFDVRKAVAFSADGIIGTGIFAESRMTLDFLNGQLLVQPSSEKPAAGVAALVRIVGDAKLVVPVKLQGESAVALLDTGADVFTVSPSRLERLFPEHKITTISSPMLTLGVGDEQGPEISLTPGVEFVFAGRKYENYGGLGLDVLDTLLSPMMGIQTDVLVGMPIMREMRTLTVDFPRCRMWVEWLESE
ncbi:MAG: aspartyl protease family protein [Planctomycetota bacterium]